MVSSPYINRFLSADTIVPGAANPQAWNRYSYVLGNPLKYTDPTGHMQESDDYTESDGQCGQGDTSCNWTDEANNNNDNHGDDDEDNSGGAQFSLIQPNIQNDGPFPPDWLQWLDGWKLVWRSGPEWLFNEGRRIIMIDHPHIGVAYWHINTDLKNLPHTINIENAVRTITAGINGISALTNNAVNFIGGSEIVMPLIFPNPGILNQQPEIYSN